MARASDESEEDIGVDEPDPLDWTAGQYAPFPPISEHARAEAQEDAAVLLFDAGYTTERTPPRASRRAPAAPPPDALPPPRPMRAPPKAKPITGGMVACAAAVVRTTWECAAGAWELARTAVEALRAALSIAPMYAARADAPDSSAVRGALLALVLAQVATLFVQIGIVVAVGTTGAYADVVHIRYAETQVAALAAVPLGVYVYVAGGVDPTSPGGAHVYTLYMVCELLKALGDAVCAARLVAVLDDAHHLAAAIAPAHVVPSTDPWDHGVCGQPHAVRVAMIALAVLGAALSGLNVVSLLGRDRSKAKAADDEVPAPAPTAPVRAAPSESNSRRRHETRREPPAPVVRAPPPAVPVRRPAVSPSGRMLLDALVDFDE